jgi:hypothetical protein
MDGWAAPAAVTLRVASIHPECLIAIACVHTSAMHVRVQSFQKKMAHPLKYQLQ